MLVFRIIEYFLHRRDRQPADHTTKSMVDIQHLLLVFTGFPCASNYCMARNRFFLYGKQSDHADDKKGNMQHPPFFLSHSSSSSSCAMTVSSSSILELVTSPGSPKHGGEKQGQAVAEPSDDAVRCGLSCLERTLAFDSAKFS